MMQKHHRQKLSNEENYVQKTTTFKNGKTINNGVFRNRSNKIKKNLQCYSNSLKQHYVNSQFLSQKIKQTIDMCKCN